MVDLSTLKVGDAVVQGLINSTITKIEFLLDDNYPFGLFNRHGFMGSYTKTGRYRLERPSTGDIVQIIPAAPVPDSQPSVAECEDDSKWRDGLGADPQYCRVVDDRPASGIKHDSGKPDMSLLPADVLWEVAEVLTHGAKVYGKYNWTKGFDYTRLQAAVLRHINQWSRGIEKDADSGKSHLTHALCGLMMLRAMELRGLGTDDRDTTGYEKK